ncbi:MAG: hypothetical protein JO142_06935 [Burkholderiales bacterium]|nr:hypothetical protein [Burkholderiales bacterium]
MTTLVQSNASTRAQTQETAFYGADGSLYAATATWLKAHGAREGSSVDFAGLALRCMALAQAELDTLAPKPASAPFTLCAESIVSQPMLDSAGRIIGALVSAGYHPSGSHETEIASLEGRIKALTHAYDELCYSISHDLHSPLRAVEGFASMLARRADTRLDEEDKRLLAVVRESGLRMGVMLEELLALSRLNRQEMVPNVTDMRPLVMDAWLDEGGSFTGEFQVDALPSAWCDRTLIKQVWRRLLNNAVKFNRADTPGRIAVRGWCEGREACFQVHDNGVGFDNRYAPKLFGLFQRLHGPDEFQGIGAGLATVARIVDRHGGRVWASSERDKGSVFGFSLPRETAAQTGAAEAFPAEDAQ